MLVVPLHTSLAFFRPKPGLQEQADPSSSAWHDSLGSKQALGSPTIQASIRLSFQVINHCRLKRQFRILCKKLPEWSGRWPSYECWSRSVHNNRRFRVAGPLLLRHRWSRPNTTVRISISVTVVTRLYCGGMLYNISVMEFCDDG